MSGGPFRLGVNYWPRRKAMGWWSDFDAEEVRDEFALVAELGMDVARVFLLWEDWQPEPDVVSPACLRNLRTVCDVAEEAGLGLDVTFFTGHMSGPNWVPPWLLDAGAGYPVPYVRQVVSEGSPVDSGYRDPFTDPVAIGAARLLVDTVVGELKDHPGVWMWNLGNEPDLLAWPPTAEAGRAWVRDLKGRIDRLDGRRPVTCGLHADSLVQDNGLRVHEVFAETDAAVMHAYPMYLDWARHELDPDLVPFTCALVTALSGRPTLMEEWGGPTAPPGEDSQTWEWTAYGRPKRQFVASEEDLAAYVQTVLPKLVEVGATGSLLWCFADYAEELWNRPPCDEARHERHFGLIRPDGGLKPHAEAIRAFARGRPTVREPARTVSLDVTPDAYYRAPAEHARRLYAAYLERYET